MPEAEFSFECQVVPKLILKVLTVPRFLKGLVNSFNRLWKKLLEKLCKYNVFPHFFVVLPAYGRNHSTKTALLKAMNDILLNINKL